MTLQELQVIFPSATADTWHQHPNGGGWVQNTARVDPSAFVENNALVYGNAWVSGNAQVSGNAWVYGNARVYGDAWVSGNARVSGNAWEVSPLYIQGSAHALTVSSYGDITVGCETLTIAEWLKRYRAIGRLHGYTKAQIAEYGEYIKLATKYAKRVAAQSKKAQAAK